MDKITFLAALSEKLTVYPLSDEELNLCIAKVTEYLGTISDEDFSKEDLGDKEIMTMANTVYQKYIESKTDQNDDPEQSESNDVSESETVPAQEGNDEPPQEEMPPEPDESSEKPEDILEILAREAEEERKNQEKLEELKRIAIERAIAENDEIITKDEDLPSEKTELQNVFEADDNDPVIEPVDSKERPDIAYEESEAIKKDASFDVAEENDYEFIEETDESFLVDDKTLKKVDDAQKNAGKKKEKIQGTPVFWTIFILLLPIICPLFIALASIFAVAYIAVTVIIVALCAAIVGIVALGTVIALVGIIYGVIETFKIAPLGMFEVGIGISVGGATMLLSVLLYNLAIRFAPKLYTCLTKLAKLIVKQLAKLYITAKKECGR